MIPHDYSAIADKGLEAARRYAKIAPAAAHAQHVHRILFTRLGYLGNDSIRSNVEFSAGARPRRTESLAISDAPWIIWSMQTCTGQDRKAKA